MKTIEDTEDTPARIHRAMYGKSDDPEHLDNCANGDFQRGYRDGQEQRRDVEGIDSITLEYGRIGSPDELPQSFLDWKRGFWAGCLRKSFGIARP